ncbi:MAG: molecular chaperone HtpG [Anaerolineae bacterium]|nr:molecular chaperone HtpG [Anaerolineae bacterium]MDW8171246.1 molecular chaperone HtpG [Anaerolineae bacterium]
MSEQFTFQAETQQLLDILIHSLYTEREIFLRELLSNASDALHRLQFEQLTNPNVLDPAAPLEVRIFIDKEARTLTIRDTGIGMTRDEIIANLGTIARSGAKQFMQAVRDKSGDQASAIIGQFGVGFYSAFMVADEVRVISRSYRPDAQAVQWRASGGTSYEIDSADKAERGTDVILHLKEDADEFLQPWKLHDIIRRHSDYVAFPIYVVSPKPEGQNDQSQVEERPANSQQAIWRRAPQEITEDDYKGFYRAFSMEFEPPLHHIHVRADVPLQYYALLYIPASNQPGMFSLRKQPGLKLYARKILIQEYNTDLLPDYLSFVQGVVDSEDLPLNVSRESIKADRGMVNLKNALTKRVLSDLRKLMDKERERYLPIYKQYARFLKQGLVMHPTERAELEQLLLFNSSRDDSPDSWVSLSEAVERMVSGQQELYYVVADDFASARRSPHLEAFRARGIEVLYFCDPVDAMLPMSLTEFRGYKLRAVDDANIDLKDVGQAPQQAEAEAIEDQALLDLVGRMKAVLGERVRGVRASRVLVGSAARLVSDDDSQRRHMFRINRLLDREVEWPVMTLEVNPRHPLLHNLSKLSADSPTFGLIVEQLYETALLQEGMHPDPSSMAERLTQLMQAASQA